MNLVLTVYSHRTLALSCWIDSTPVLYSLDPTGPRTARATRAYDPHPQPTRNAGVDA